MNPNSQIPHLQAQLVFAWHNRLVLDRRLSAVSWYSRCSQPTLRDDTKVSRGQSPTRTDIRFYVLVTLVDTMRLNTIQLAAGPQMVFGGEGGTYWLWYAVL